MSTCVRRSSDFVGAVATPGNDLYVDRWRLFKRRASFVKGNLSRRCEALTAGSGGAHGRRNAATPPGILTTPQHASTSTSPAAT